MNKKKYKILKNTVMFFSVVVCIWALVEKMNSVSEDEKVNALLYVSGIFSKRGESEEKPKAKQVAKKEEKDVNVMPFLERDEIVPFHQDELPKINATPNPNRPSMPVEEIMAEGGTRYDNFFVKDTTASGTDLWQELGETPAVELKANGEIEVLLYHTHTTESYTDQFMGYYYTDMETRSRNFDDGVVAVGKEIKKELEKKGIGVVHDTAINDTMFNGSYSRSWEVLQRNLAEHPGIQVTIDIHRDSMTRENGVKYKPTALINGRKAAQVMILAGCDANGDWGDFPNWRDNLRLALRAQQKLSAVYPQIVRPMNFSNSKYNMNATKGSMLIEVGTEVSTISEAKYSGSLVGEALGELFAEGWG